MRSFKAQYRQAPARAATPPPPVWEPLSPVLRAAAPSATLAAGGTRDETAHSIKHANGSAPGTTQHAPPLASPAASQRTSPAHVETPRRASYAATSPAAAPNDIGQRAPKHAFPRDAAYASAERPAKRARSEHHTSPPYGQHQRPATSHIPGYNVDYMLDNGARMPPAAPPPQANGGEKMLSDAELLLFFSNVSAHTAQTPPSTAKRWSVSQPSPMELAPQQTRQTHEPSSPYAATAHAASHQPQPQPIEDASDTKPSPELIAQPSEVPSAALAPQTQTPPEDTVGGMSQALGQDTAPAEDSKPKKHQGWPKGKPRGPRSTPSTSKRKRSTPKPKSASTASTSAGADQLQSPRSLPAEQPVPMDVDGISPVPRLGDTQAASSQNRRHSFSTSFLHPPSNGASSASFRAQSVPLGGTLVVPPTALDLARPAKQLAPEQPDLICAACKSSDSEIKVGDGEQWIGCDGCKEWYHYACAGFSSEREVRDVNKFYCGPCRPKFGETTKVRKSVRVHTTVDYAGLNEGVLKTSDDNPEHHYIAAFKNGDIEFTPETFARMPPEFITSDFLEKTNFKEPILVPGALNTRIQAPSQDQAQDQVQVQDPVDPLAASEQLDQPPFQSGPQFEQEAVADVGQDKLDMVIPAGLTVRRVAELYGSNELVPVIDVKAQEGEGKKWTMGKWADYYEQQGEKPVRNVISLEVSRSRLGKLIRRPKAVRDMDLQDSVWPEDDKFAPPAVQFYCLMSVADCFTDFHIDFGGSSVYYHIVKGRKVFFFIPPTKQNLKKYEDWCLSPNQGHDWLGKQVKECYRVDLYPGDTMLIPSGWIHAVWTPEDSLVIGGNFLTRIHYGMQIKILEIEKNTKVALQFRYPHFQKIMWLAAIQYLEEDPVPDSVRQLLQGGEQFRRDIPIYCEPDKFGHNSHLGPTNYNRRYYSKHELEGLTDLLNYIWRTVLISLDKIDVPQKTKAAVTKSIPKNRGDPLVLVKRFAMWIAWKRGNETIPSWALLDACLPEVAEAGEKKLSAAQVKKLERESLNEVLRATAERSSARIRASDLSPQVAPLTNDSHLINQSPQPSPRLSPQPDDMVLRRLEMSPPTGFEEMMQFDMHAMTPGGTQGFLRPSANNPHITTPKTSQLGPKRVACDACRKRRIRCKHKDELIDTSKPGMHTIDLSGSYGISVKRRLSDHSIADGQTGASGGPVNGGPIMADVNGDPYALKSGRVKACADCRKSKRRCIHDEYGNVDPVKANEVPIPRGSATKKRRVSDEDSTATAKRMKHESSYEDDYIGRDIHARHSLPNHFSVGSAHLQDIAFSAQQALARGQDDLVPVDPALQAYANSAFSAMEMAPSYATNGDGIMSSIEQQVEGDISMDGMDFSQHNSQAHQSLTPGPPPHNDTIHVQRIGYPTSDTIHVQSNGYPAPSTMHAQPNGFPASDTVHVQPNGFSSNAVRRPSSPVSPRHMSAVSPGTNTFDQYMASPTLNHNGHSHSLNHNNHYDFTADSDFPPPPATPTTNTRPPNSSSGIASHTPSRARASKTPRSTSGARRRDSKDGIKLEAGLGMGMNMGLMGMEMMIDPSLDQASIDLIKQLQQEELGLRRRQS